MNKIKLFEHEFFLRKQSANAAAVFILNQIKILNDGEVNP